MIRPIVFGLSGLLTATATVVKADLVVSFTPRDGEMNMVTGPVPAGSRLVVDILLAVNGADDPLSGLTLLQFDFGATTSGIELGRFTWKVDPNAYALFVNELPAPFALADVLAEPSRLLNLSTDPRLVATIEVTVIAGGTLDALGATGITQTTQALFDAGSAIPSSFSLIARNLSGGTVEFETGTSDAAPGGDDESPDNPTDDNEEPVDDSPILPTAERLADDPLEGEEQAGETPGEPGEAPEQLDEPAMNGSSTASPALCGTTAVGMLCVLAGLSGLRLAVSGQRSAISR